MATPHDRPPRAPEPRSGLTDAQKWTLGGIAAVVVLLLLVVSVVAVGGDDDEAAEPTTTTAVDTTTTTEQTTTTTTAPPDTTDATFAPAIDPYQVAFPSPEGSRSFESPVSAARAYATDVLGFTELVLGAPEETGTGAADVVIQPSEDGPETVVHLIQAADAWYATGSETPDIVVDQPSPGTSLASPFETTGEALAFEGTVQVLVFDQNHPTPRGEGIVTGSGTPPPGPFEADIAFQPPEEARPGILVYRVSSPRDGRVTAATSLPVRLTPLSS